MTKSDIIVIGASAGGFDAIKEIIRNLPTDLPVSIFIVWHMGPDVKGILPDVLNKLGTIKASNALDGEAIMANHIYVAPPDHHLLVEESRIRVTKGPKENHFRPAIDPLFRSAAYQYGSRVIGIILSGALDDGTAGLWRIKSNGGTTVVQNPKDAQVPSMPENAIRRVKIDHCVSLEDMPRLLITLASNDVKSTGDAAADEITKWEIEVAIKGDSLFNRHQHLGELSRYSCPECHGVLSQIVEDNALRFRCHTGHAYSITSLMMSLNQKVDESLYNALRGMDETIFLLNHIGDHFAEANESKIAGSYFKKAKDIENRCVEVRNLIHTNEQLSQQVMDYEIDSDEDPCGS